MVIERKAKVGRTRARKVRKGKEIIYEYGVVTIFLPKEAIGKEVRILAIIP